jgi:hypothetical protein
MLLLLIVVTSHEFIIVAAAITGRIVEQVTRSVLQRVTIVVLTLRLIAAVVALAVEKNIVGLTRCLRRKRCCHFSLSLRNLFQYYLF